MTGDPLELGQATIVYEDPEGGRTERTLDNEQLVYVRDHWAVRTGNDADGNDLMRQIPKERVHYVERNVEQFERRAATVRRRVESIASDLRRKLPVDELEARLGRSDRGGRSRSVDGDASIHVELPGRRE